MKSRTTARFRRRFKTLPPQVQQQAREAYKRFINDPYHPGLRFKSVHGTLPIYSVRISRDYRAVGVREDETIVWFWIGTHADYGKLLSQL
ncbi:MAG: hypothetical protein D6737_17765 [Chloroflexi bacterium]|nr:MAG: hypothetical protein D6737_17765 [Chloroflexota bacterium]